jgi:hypothetical protein
MTFKDIVATVMDTARPIRGFGLLAVKITAG